MQRNGATPVHLFQYINAECWFIGCFFFPFFWRSFWFYGMITFSMMWCYLFCLEIYSNLADRMLKPAKYFICLNPNWNLFSMTEIRIFVISNKQIGKQQIHGYYVISQISLEFVRFVSFRMCVRARLIFRFFILITKRKAFHSNTFEFYLIVWGKNFSNQSGGDFDVRGW